MQSNTNGFTVPQNETVELIETSIVNIKTENDELKLGLKEEWIHFIDSIDDDQIENFLWTLGSWKVLPYLRFMTFNTFVEFLKWELIHEIEASEESKVEILKLDCKEILDYLEVSDSVDLAGILPNGYDPEFDSLIELTEFDIDRLISDLQKWSEPNINNDEAKEN
jgi:hypothetical protein